MVLINPIEPAIPLIEIGEHLTGADVLAYIQVFDRYISDEQKFGCIIRYRGGSPKSRKQGTSWKTTGSKRKRSR